MLSSSQPKRVLIIDKTAGLEASHERHQAIASLPDIELNVLGPSHWIENGRNVYWNPSADAKYTVYQGKVFGKDYYARAGYYSGLIRAIRTTKPDIIQLLEEPWSVSAFQTLAVSRLFSPSSKLIFYTWENISRGWNYPSRGSWLYRLIDKAMHKHAAGAICATNQAHQVLLQKGFNHRTAIIPYGIPQFFFNHNNSYRKEQIPFTVGYIGRMLEMKGIDLLISAVVQINNIHLVLIGSGKDETKFRELSHQYDLANRIKWIPSVPENDIPSLLQQMSVLVLPSRTTSRWTEQLGRVLIEAMAVGTPVIGSSSGAIPEVIGNAGLIFQEDNVDDLCKQIQTIRSNPELRQSLIEKGKQRAVKQFTWQRFADDLVGFYNNLC